MLAWRLLHDTDYKDGPVQCVSMVLGARAYDAIFNSILVKTFICGIDKRKTIQSDLDE